MAIAIGCAALWFGRHLPVGDASFMEAGYMPRLLAFMVIGLGAIVAIGGLVAGGPPMEAWVWRPILLLCLAVIGFATMIDRIGLVATTAVTTVAASLAGEWLGARRIAALVVAMIVMMVSLFHFGLALPIPLWPAFR
jgi:putative tricarboxylic transport membrane protein